MGKLYTLAVVRTTEALRALRAEWMRLYQESRPRNPFLSYEWAEACWEHLGAGSELFIITARHGDRLVGIAPLRLDRERGFRVLRFIAAGWTEYTGCLRAPECPEVEASFMRELAARGGEWDLAQLRQLADGFTSLHRLEMPPRMRAARVEGAGSPYLAHEGDWESLCAAGPGWLKNVQKRVRRFARDGGVVERYVGGEAAVRMEEVAAIEARSWQARYGQPVFRRPEVRQFIARALEMLAAREEMELWIARVDGEPAAFEINLLTPERVWLFRGGYHEEFAKLGPGAVLEFYSIRQAWEAGRREYDYMSGEEPYKGERTNAVRPLQYLFAHPTTLRGFLAYALLVAPRWNLKKLAPLRPALQLLSWLKNCPKALLPASGVIRSRVH